MTDETRLTPQQEEALREYVAQQAEAQRFIRSLTLPQLAALSDRELFDAVRLRLIDEAHTADEDTVIPLARQVMHVIVAFYDEFRSGGLCLFFAGAGRVLAPDLADCLIEVGAEDHAELLTAFMNVHGVNPEDLESFACTSTAQLLETSQRLPFDDFDRTFEDLMKDQPLEPLCAAYIRKHFPEFA